MSSTPPRTRKFPGKADQALRPRPNDPVINFPIIYFPRETRIHYTPWLVVRYAIGDNGSRPVPAGSITWESPDIFVKSRLGTNQPIPGEDNTVFARVSNLGLQDATGVIVRF